MIYLYIFIDPIPSDITAQLTSTSKAQYQALSVQMMADRTIP